MSTNSLADKLAVEDPVEMLRREEGAQAFPIPADILWEATEPANWIEEQRAWRESCGVSDFSHHMVDFRVRGPDTQRLHEDCSVNSYENFEAGTAKQIVAVNPDGYVIGDGILFKFDENDYMTVGLPTVPNWLQYHIETGDYDVEFDRFGRTHEIEGNREHFRYQLMGPETDNVVNEIADEPLPELPFFNFREISINGAHVYAFRHTMTGKGMELFGDWEHGEDIWNALLETNETYGTRILGTRAAFGNISVVSGWFPLPVPAVYDHEDLEGYREWLEADGLEGICPLGGSFVSDDITDYYVTPFDIGYDRVLKFDRDFTGREALEEVAESPPRKPVTLIWDPEDFLDIFGSLFREGDTYKFFDFPLVPWDSAHYDRVEKDGELVGLSQWYGYTYNERKMLSEASVDVEYAEPGTEVTIVWGEENSPKSNVERHVEKEITATVAAMPFAEDERSSR